MTATDGTELACAGFFSRLTAFVVDLIVIAAAVGAGAWVVGSVKRLLRPSAPGELAPVLGLAVPLLTAAYYVGSWAAFGQTAGKRLLGLRVVRADGTPVSLGRAALRLVGYLLSALPLYLGFAWILVDARHRGWHDLLAGTLVVYDRTTIRSPHPRHVAEVPST